MTSVLEDAEPANFTLSTEMNKVTYCLDCGRLATDLCANDARGSRVATAYLAAEDVPKRNCDCHVSVSLCQASGSIANEFCPLEGQTVVSLLNFQRAYPSSEPLTIGDQGYCMPYELTEEQIAQGLIKPDPGTYLVCTTHTEPEPEPEFDPFDPFFPDDSEEDDWWNDHWNEDDYTSEDSDSDREPSRDDEESSNREDDESNSDDNWGLGNFWDSIFGP